MKESENIPEYLKLFRELKKLWNMKVTVIPTVTEKPHKELGSGTNSRRKKLDWGENPERNLPERCTVTITICNSDDTIQSYI